MIQPQINTLSKDVNEEVNKRKWNLWEVTWKCGVVRILISKGSVSGFENIFNIFHFVVLGS